MTASGDLFHKPDTGMSPLEKTKKKHKKNRYTSSKPDWKSRVKNLVTSLVQVTCSAWTVSFRQDRR